MSSTQSARIGMVWVIVRVVHVLGETAAIIRIPKESGKFSARLGGA